MNRSRARSIARAVLVGLACPVAAAASIFVGISIVMSVAYLSTNGEPSAATLERAAEASRFLQRCAPILTALFAAGATLRARERFVEHALGVGVAATAFGMAIGLAIGEPHWTVGAAVAATVVPTMATGLAAGVAALRELRLGERARAVCALEAATWRHEVFGVVLRLAGADQTARIALVDVAAEAGVLASWPDGAAGLPAADLAAMVPRDATRPTRSGRIAAFPAGPRAEGRVVLAIELAGTGGRLARPETLAAVAADVARALARVARLERARDAALDRERRRVADAVHDTLAQDLTHTVRALEAASERAPGADPALVGALESARRGLAGARHLIAASRAGVDALAAPRGASLACRVRAAVAEVSRGLDADVSVHVDGAPAPLDAAAEELLVRAAREGVTNARKHAFATRVVVTLTYAGDVARLDVRDDGVGFASGAAAVAMPGERVGLASLREAAAGLGASLDLESEPGLGASLAVEVPRAEAARVA